MNIRDDKKVIKQGVEKLNALIKSRDEFITERKKCETQIDKLNTNIKQCLVDMFLPIAKLKKVSLLVDLFPKEGHIVFALRVTPEPATRFNSHVIGIYTCDVQWKELNNADIKSIKSNLLESISKFKRYEGLIPVVPDGIVRAEIIANNKYF